MIADRIAKFREPPHIVEARRSILEIQLDATAHRASITRAERRWNRAMVAVAWALATVMAARLAWAMHLGIFPG